MAKKLLLSIQDVVALLGLSEGTVRKLCRLGHLKGPFKIAGEKTAKFQRKHVKEYLKDLERGRLPPVTEEEAEKEE